MHRAMRFYLWLNITSDDIYQVYTFTITFWIDYLIDSKQLFVYSLTSNLIEVQSFNVSDFPITSVTA